MLVESRHSGIWLGAEPRRSSRRRKTQLRRAGVLAVMLGRLTLLLPAFMPPPPGGLAVGGLRHRLDVGCHRRPLVGERLWAEGLVVVERRCQSRPASGLCPLVRDLCLCMRGEVMVHRPELLRPWGRVSHGPGHLLRQPMRAGVRLRRGLRGEGRLRQNPRCTTALDQLGRLVAAGRRLFSFQDHHSNSLTPR